MVLTFKQEGHLKESVFSGSGGMPGICVFLLFLDSPEKHYITNKQLQIAFFREARINGNHTRGSPIMRIPPRPVVEPALAKDDLRAEMGEKLMASCEAALEGNLPETKKGLEEAWKRGADGIREYIDSQIPPPNSPVTLSGGWIYNRVAKKGVYVEGKNGSTPMKDTGALYDDFDK